MTLPPNQNFANDIQLWFFFGIPYTYRINAVDNCVILLLQRLFVISLSEVYNVSVRSCVDFKSSSLWVIDIPFEFFLKIILFVLFQGLTTAENFHGTKYWNQTTNFFDRLNWRNNELPCASDRITFPRSVSLVSVLKSVKISQFVSLWHFCSFFFKLNISSYPQLSFWIPKYRRVISLLRF